MQPGNMDAHQMRMLFSQLDNPMMMPMQMPFFIPTTTAAAGGGKPSEKEKDKSKSLDPSLLSAFPTMPGMSPFPYGMYPYTPGISPVQMPLMMPLGASPFMPYNLFPYPGMPIPKDGEAKSGTTLLKELSNNSKRAQAEKSSTSSKKTPSDTRLSPYDRESDLKTRHSPAPKSDGKKFSDIVQSAIMEGFKDTEKDKVKEKDKKVYRTSPESALDFTTKHRSSPVREHQRKHKELPRQDQYLHLLQKSSHHSKHLKEKDKPNTAKLKIEALIDFGKKKPTLSNLKLDLEKGMDDIGGPAFSASSDRYKFSPDTTYRGDERKTWYEDYKERRPTDLKEELFANMTRDTRIRSETLPRRMSKGGLYPGEIPRQMFGDRLAVPEMDFDDPDVLRGEAHQVRLARYNAERLRMNSFYKSDNCTYVEQVEPDSTGDLSEEVNEQGQKGKGLKEHERELKQSEEQSPGPQGDHPKRQRVESPSMKFDSHASSLQDLKIDSSETNADKRAKSPPLKDSTVRDKILSYIKSRSKQKQDFSQMPPLVPELPIQQHLKLQPGLSIVDSWKHQLAPSLETTAQATLEEVVLDHWRQSLSSEFSQLSKNTLTRSSPAPEAAAGSFATMPTLKPISNLQDTELEPGEICRKVQSPMNPLLAFPTIGDSANIPETNVSRDSPVIPNTQAEKLNDFPPLLERVKPLDKGKRKAESPFSISDIIGTGFGTDWQSSITSETRDMKDDDTSLLCSSEVANDQTLTAEKLGALSCDVTSESLTPSKHILASPESDRSDSSQKSKKSQRKEEDDANTVSAAFALEAVKALDCFSFESSSGCSPDNSNSQVNEPHDPYLTVPGDDVEASPGLRMGFGPSTLRKLKKTKKTKKKYKFGSKKHSSKNTKQSGQNMSVLACTDISNVKMSGELAFTGIFSEKVRKRRGRPPKNGKPIRKRGRPCKIKRTVVLNVGEKKRGPGRPRKVESLKRPEILEVSNNFVPTDHLVNKDSEESRDTSSDQSGDPPQRKKRSPLFYGCNYNDNFLMGALRIKLPKNEKKMKRKRLIPEPIQKPSEPTLNTELENDFGAVENSEEMKDSLQPDLDNAGLSTARKTKECSVLLKDVSPLLADEQNVNVKETPWSEKVVAPESEKENKDESSGLAGSRPQSPARVFSRPQVARKSTPWKSKQSAGNRLVLVKDPSKNGYFVKYSDALREETEKLGPSEISGDVIDTVVNSVMIDQNEPRFDDQSLFNDSNDEFFDPVSDTELHDVTKKPSMVDRFKASLLNEVSGKKRKGISQRSRSTDDLTSIKGRKVKKSNRVEFDLYKNGMPASPSAREERVSALKEKLKLQQAKIAEIQWSRVESGAQSE